MQRLYLTLDLGGTSLRIALLDEEGNILHLHTRSAEEVREPKNLIAVLRDECLKMAALAGNQSIAGLALGIPGLVDGERGIVYQSPHFPLWQEVKLKETLLPHFSFPIFMDNDANQAALGEAWKGAGKAWSDFVLLTLGTGIGAGIILEGKIFHGPHGFAGEVGHMVIDRNGLPGALGSGGTLESLASLSGLQLHLKEIQKKKFSLPPEILHLDPSSGKLPEELMQLAKDGNEVALAIWKDFGQALGCGLAGLGHILGVFRFVIGGGLSGAWELFYEPCFEEASRRSYTITAKQIQIVPAQLGNKAGLIGGVRLVERLLVKQKKT